MESLTSQPLKPTFILTSDRDHMTFSTNHWKNVASEFPDHCGQHRIMISNYQLLLIVKPGNNRSPAQERKSFSQGQTLPNWNTQIIPAHRHKNESLDFSMLTSCFYLEKQAEGTQNSIRAVAVRKRYLFLLMASPV